MALTLPGGKICFAPIGHEILFQPGDSVSRVLPVKKIAKDEYQVSFENAFTFQPESLVNSTQRLLAKGPLASNYVLNVLNCANAIVAHGYVISKNMKEDIVACIGRGQPIACYMINTAVPGEFFKCLPLRILQDFTGFPIYHLTVTLEPVYT